MSGSPFLAFTAEAQSGGDGKESQKAKLKSQKAKVKCRTLKTFPKEVDFCIEA
jgi:hypothetical protein